MGIIGIALTAWQAYKQENQLERMGSTLEKVYDETKIAGTGIQTLNDNLYSGANDKRSNLQVANDEVKREDDQRSVHIRFFLKNFGDRATIATVNLRAFFNDSEVITPSKNNSYPARIEFPPNLERPIEFIFFELQENYAALWEGRRKVVLQVTADYEATLEEIVRLSFEARLVPETGRMAIIRSKTTPKPSRNKSLLP